MSLLLLRSLDYSARLHVMTGERNGMRRVAINGWSTPSGAVQPANVRIMVWPRYGVRRCARELAPVEERVVFGGINVTGQGSGSR